MILHSLARKESTVILLPADYFGDPLVHAHLAVKSIVGDPLLTLNIRGKDLRLSVIDELDPEKQIKNF
jgi:hypothetical protein